MTSLLFKKKKKILHGSSIQQIMDGEQLWLEWGRGGGSELRLSQVDASASLSWRPQSLSLDPPSSRQVDLLGS